MSPRDIAIATFISFLWGVNYLAIKYGVDHIPPIFFMFLRAILVSILLFPFILKLPRNKLKPMFLVALTMGFLYFSVMFSGTKYISPGEAAIIVQLQVPFTVIVSTIFLREAISIRIILGIIVAFLGVIVTIGLPNKHDGATIGVVLLLTSSLISAFANLSVKLLGKVDPLVTTANMSIMSAPMLLIASLLFEPGAYCSLKAATWQVWLSLAYVAIASSVISYTIWFKLIGKYELNKVAPFNLLVPIFAVFAASIYEHHLPIEHVVIGGLICVTGVGLVVVKKTKQESVS
jgi:O-acetylserine/cysteine efflux transporter